MTTWPTTHKCGFCGQTITVSLRPNKPGKPPGPETVTTGHLDDCTLNPKRHRR